MNLDSCTKAYVDAWEKFLEAQIKNAQNHWLTKYRAKLSLKMDQGGFKEKVEAKNKHWIELFSKWKQQTPSTYSFLQLQPVHWAVIGGQIDILRVLLDSGLSAVGKSEKRLTPLHLAFLLTDVSLCDLLWATIHPSGEDTSWTEIIQDLEPTVNNEDYPIHFVAAYGMSAEFWEPTELLSISQMGPGPRTNRLGERPIHRAAAMGNILAVQNLLIETFLTKFGSFQLFRTFDNIGPSVSHS